MGFVALIANAFSYQPSFLSMLFFVLYYRLDPSSKAGDLAKKLLRLIPRNRLLAEDALAHEYFSSLPPGIFTLPDCKSIATDDAISLVYKNCAISIRYLYTFIHVLLYLYTVFASFLCSFSISFPSFSCVSFLIVNQTCISSFILGASVFLLPGVLFYR